MEMNDRDRLDIIFDLQKSLDRDIQQRRGLDFTMEQWIQKDVLAMISELSELLDEVNFKWWKNKKPVDEAALHGELVDILHFFVSMCIRAGMSPDKLYEGYIEKNRENFDRQYGRSSKKGYDVNEGELPQ
ncbi:MAG: dUTPase [Clostridia bacterium]|nr:dUTPase [Clostridia bacterium]MBR3459607.1 dUTPase [Clostridia bacterium]